MASSPESPHPRFSEPTFFDRFWWGLHSNVTLLALVLLILACVAVAFLFRPLFQPVQEDSRPGVSLSGMPWALHPARESQTFYFAWPREGENSDIYQWSPSSQPINLTNTSHFSEWWPVPSPGGDLLAFFAVSSGGERSLRVMDAAGAVVDVTYNPADSGLGKTYQIDLTIPPQWSEDGVWIAFLGFREEGKETVTDIFVADVAHSTVYRLTQGGKSIIDLRWLDASHLIYARQETPQSVAFYQIAVSTEPVVPVLLNVIEAGP